VLCPSFGASLLVHGCCSAFGVGALADPAPAFEFVRAGDYATLEVPLEVPVVPGYNANDTALVVGCDLLDQAIEDDWTRGAKVPGFGDGYRVVVCHEACTDTCGPFFPLRAVKRCRVRSDCGHDFIDRVPLG
jgi:hypothetical protein